MVAGYLKSESSLYELIDSSFFVEMRETVKFFSVK